MSKYLIQETVTVDPNGKKCYRYFAVISETFWLDLTPFGNKMPTIDELDILYHGMRINILTKE